MYRILLCGSKPTKIYFCPRLLLSNFIESPCRSRKKYREEKRRDQWWVPGRSTEQTEYKCFLLLLLGSSVEKENLFFLIALKPIHGMPAQGAGILQAGSACRPKQRAKQLCCSVHTVAPREAWAQPCAKCVHVLQITTLACLQALLLFIPSPPSIFLTSPCSRYRLKY